jgi:hypothetical protein
MAFGVCDLLFGESIRLGVEEGVDYSEAWSLLTMKSVP